ncbi:MAG: sodium:solute symporter family transporter [Nannocystaceae bacterium]|nr:sodium:solute symporter family protein [bacterium]
MSALVTTVLLVAYLGLLAWLGVAGMKKTTTLSSFAIGNKDMNPVLVGVAMASSIASTATFVINPGFVYVDGWSAFLHYAVAAQAGVIVGLIAVSRGFRRLGDQLGALTIPDWVRQRYRSEGLGLFFAVINLLSLAFIVLILFGCALLLTNLTGLGHVPALIIVVIVVFGYVLAGGTYAHTYTNAAQAFLMMVVAVALFFTGWEHIGDGEFFSRLREVGPSYASVTNETSLLYGDAFAVFVSGFTVTFALMLQPHVLTKVLYLRSDRDLRTFLFTTFVVGGLFSLCLFVGFYARLDGMPMPGGGQDHVVTTYVSTAFGSGTLAEGLTAAVFVALLAAGMSTLDGILVAVSAMVTHDLYLRGPRADASPRKALAASRWAVIIIGLVAFAMAIDPPALVGLFAQKGVYGLAAASFVPLVFGVLRRGPLPVVPVAVASGFALALHFSLHLSGTLPNPAVSASWAILASTALGLVLLYVAGRRSPKT